MTEGHDNWSKDDDVRWQPSGARQIAKGNPQGERGGVHQFGVPPKTAMRDSAPLQPTGTLRVVSEAKDNNANCHQSPVGLFEFAWVQHFIHHLAPQTALRDSAILRSGATPQVMNETKDNMAGFVLANGSMSSNQSGEGTFESSLGMKTSSLLQRATAWTIYK